MRKDMTRWVEVAAIKGHDKDSDPGHRWQDLTDWQREMVRDTIRRDVVNFLQAAVADGVKLVPEAATEAMKDEGWQVDGCHPHDVWEAMWHHTPNYLDDDA